MGAKFNPYQTPITATKKAIESRQMKLKEYQELERLALDAHKRFELMRTVGRTEIDVELSTGAKKKAAEKKLKELNRKVMLLERVFSEKNINLIFKWEDEIRGLNQVLIQLQRLSSNHVNMYDLRGKDGFGY